MKKEMIQFGLIDYHHHYFHFLRIILHLALIVLLDFDLIKVKDYIYIRCGSFKSSKLISLLITDSLVGL